MLLTTIMALWMASGGGWAAPAGAAISTGAQTGASANTQAASLTAQQIMARVAANQDRSDNLRSQYVYKQHIHVVSRKTNKKVMCEESVDYLVVPTPSGIEKQPKLIAGRYWSKGHYVDFNSDKKIDHEGVDTDLVHDFVHDLADDKSKDGLARDLFPLTSKEQQDYQFHLIGTETLNGRPVYHLAFGPKDNSEYTWAGEALIDATDFEPVNVFTRLSKKLPLVVRALLVSLPGVGFNVDYARQPDGVWFPASFGTEFRIRVLGFFARDLTVSLRNNAFEHTHVKTRITPHMPASARPMP